MKTSVTSYRVSRETRLRIKRIAKKTILNQGDVISESVKAHGSKLEKEFKKI